MKKIFCSLVCAVMIFFANNLSVHAEQLQYLNEETVQVTLANTKTAQVTDQIILVVDHNFSLWNKTEEGWWRREIETYCGYGKNGLNSNRHEGDSTTPVGSFPILYAFGKATNPGTAMTYRDITPHSYLSGEHDTYNTWVESPYRKMNGEHLTDYYQYKYAMNIGFNINPTVLGKGSAIFLHCKSVDRWFTAGCVSLEEKDMVEVLRLSHDGEYIIIVPRVEDIANY